MDDDHISIRLPRDDAAALVHELDSLIADHAGTGVGTLLRGLQTALTDAFGHIKPEHRQVGAVSSDVDTQRR
jgi:hypothetical protein